MGTALAEYRQSDCPPLCRPILTLLLNVILGILLTQEILGESIFLLLLNINPPPNKFMKIRDQFMIIRVHKKIT